MSKNRNNQTIPTEKDFVGDTTDVLEGKTFFGKGQEVEPVEKEKTRLIGVVTAERLNIRTSPTINDKNIIGMIRKDTEVLIESSDGDFYKVLTKAGDDGYCMKEFIKLRGE